MGIPHTGTCTYTYTGTHRQIPFLHFTNLIFGTPHTHKYTQTHAHTQTQIPFLHFALFGIHAKDIWHTTDWTASNREVKLLLTVSFLNDALGIE